MATNVTKEVIELTAIDNASRVIQGVTSSAQRLGDQYTKLAAMLGVGLGIGYFAHLVKGSIDAADKLRDLSKSTDITVEDLAGLSLLAKQTGTDLDGLAKGINRMSVEMGKDREKFRALGITATDNKGAFQQFADVFNQLPDIQQRNALAQAVFSKSWAEMAPALSEGGKRIGEIIERGAKLSGVTKEITEQADALNDKWVELTGTGGLMMRMVGPLLPFLNELADGLLKARDNSDSLKASFNPLVEVMKVLIVIGSDVAFVFQTIGKDIARAVENVQLIAKGDFAGSRELGEVFRRDAAAARKALDEYQARIMGLSLTGKAAAVATPADPAAAAAASARAAAFLNGGRGGAGAAGQDFSHLFAVWEMQVKAEKELQARVKETNDALEERAKIQERIADQREKSDAIITQALYNRDRGGVIPFDEDTSMQVEKVQEKIKETNDFARQMGLTFSSAFEKAILGGQKFSAVLKGIAQDIMAIVLRKSVTEPLGNWMSGQMSGSTGGGGASNWFSMAASAVSSYFGGGAMSSGAFGLGGGYAMGGIHGPDGPVPLRTYASGGVANSPQLAMFGEGSTPEAYVPLPDGRRIPVAMKGGGGGLVVNINAPGADAAALGRVQAEIRALHASFDGRAVGAVRRAYNRNGVTTALG